MRSQNIDESQNFDNRANKSVSACSQIEYSVHFVIKELPYKETKQVPQQISLHWGQKPEIKKKKKKWSAEANKQATIILQHYSLPVNAF